MKRLLLTGLVLGISGGSPEASSDDPDQGWVSTLQYAPDTGFTYTLGSMRDGRSIPVFLGLKAGNRKVVADEENYKVSIPNPENGNEERGTYEYRFRDLYAGTTHLSQVSTWEFSIQRKITALRDVQLKWWDNYLSAHLVAGKPSLNDRSAEPVIISKDPLPVGEMFDVLGAGKQYRRMSMDSAIGKIDLQFSVPMGLVDHRTAPWRGQDDAFLLYNDFPGREVEAPSRTEQRRFSRSIRAGSRAPATEGATTGIRGRLRPSGHGPGRADSRQERAGRVERCDDASAAL